jgi:GABA permease
MPRQHVNRRILVIANETIEGRVLHDALLAQPGTELLLVAPALNTRLRRWTGDEDGARRAAEGRLTSSLARLRDAGAEARGWVGDADPMVAIAEALGEFDADELLIATHPEHRSNWLEHDLVSRACARFSLPVAHLVVEHPGLPAALATAA